MQHPHGAENKGVAVGVGIILFATLAQRLFSGCLQPADNMEQVEDNSIEEAPTPPPTETMGGEIIEEPLPAANQSPEPQKPSSSPDEGEEVDGFLMVTGATHHTPYQ